MSNDRTEVARQVGTCQVQLELLSAAAAAASAYLLDSHKWYDPGISKISIY